MSSNKSYTAVNDVCILDEFERPVLFYDPVTKESFPKKVILKGTVVTAIKDGPVWFTAKIPSYRQPVKLLKCLFKEVPHD